MSIKNRPVSPHACDIIYTALNNRITVDAFLLNEIMAAIHEECISRERRLIVGSVKSTANQKRSNK